MSVLILTQPGHLVNRFGRYTAEILRADGFADLDVARLGEESLAVLDEYDVVILRTSLPPRAQVLGLVEYVRGGGRVILLRPSRLLAETLGLPPNDRVVFPTYVFPDGAHPISRGVPQESIQTHVPADRYGPASLPPERYPLTPLPADATVAARLCTDSETPTDDPAIVHFSLGQGQVVVFTYDLPQAVALIRQGNPALVGWNSVAHRERYRAIDLFPGHVDRRRAHLPQADIHGMLLGNAINLVAKAPQPRWWYYPTPELKSLIVLDGDDDWSTPEQFDTYIEGVERAGGHTTIYLMLGPTRSTIATPDKVTAWRARGHTFGTHHDAYDSSYEGEEQDAVLECVVRRDIAYFREQYGEVPLTNRNHGLVWKGYVDLPRLYAELGVRMETSVLSYKEYWLTYMNGSGRPMRFVDTDGTVTDCFQQPTQAFDDGSVKRKLTDNPYGEAEQTLRLLGEKITRYFSPLMMLSHPVSYATHSKPYMDTVWETARDMGVPLWSAFEWASFILARDRATICSAGGLDDRHRWIVAGTSPRGPLTLMVPVGAADAAETTVTVDGQPVQATGQRAFGWRYLLVPIPLDPSTPREHEVTVSV